MLSRVVLGVVVGIIVMLACTLVGGLLMSFEISWVVAIGAFLRLYASLLGLCAALWYAFAGYSRWPWH